MVAVTPEMAKAAAARGFTFRAQMPVIYARFDNGIYAGTVRLVGVQGHFALVKKNDGCPDTFRVSFDTLTVEDDVAEHLQKAWAWIDALTIRPLSQGHMSQGRQDCYGRGMR